MPSQFSITPIELGRARLVALDPRGSDRLAAAIVEMPPWSVMNYPADVMARFLSTANGCVSRYAVEIGGEQVGGVSVRSPWLKGPYLELLALLPVAQGQGIGSAILIWFEQEALEHGAISGCAPPRSIRAPCASTSDTVSSKPQLCPGWSRTAMRRSCCASSRLAAVDDRAYACRLLRLRACPAGSLICGCFGFVASPRVGVVVAFLAWR
jgi:GNAT superfamily N-acetyltransferase